MDYIIGLDLGTTACKAVALGMDGSVGGKASAGYPLHAPHSGAAEQDPDDILGGALSALKGLSEQLPGAVFQGISISGAMHSVLLLDAHGQPLGRALTWADQRAASQVPGLRAEADASAIYQRTGCPLQSIYHPAKLRWCRQNRTADFAKVAAIKEYVLHRLTGDWACDVSLASATGLIDIHRRTWDPEALTLAGIDESHLLPLVPAETLVGFLRAEIAAATGLPAGLPVVIGGSDGGMAVLGAGGSTVITVGTSGAIRSVVDQPLLDDQARTWCYVLDASSWLAGGAINNGGLVAQWLHDKFYPQESFETMLHEAGDIPPGSDGVVFLPYLSGERSPHWNPFERALISGIGLEHSRAHIARAALEGVAFCLADVWHIVGAAESARLTGGITRSLLWAQIVCEVLGAPLGLVEAADASAAGAARLGWAALGYEFPRPPEPEQTLTFDPARHALYKKYYAEFTDRYRQNYG